MVDRGRVAEAVTVMVHGRIIDIFGQLGTRNVAGELTCSIINVGSSTETGAKKDLFRQRSSTKNGAKMVAQHRELPPPREFVKNIGTYAAVLHEYCFPSFISLGQI